MTEQIGAKIAAALVAFQAEIPKVHKGKTAKVPTKAGGSYSYKYADLADVTEAAMPALTKHGLAFIAAPRQTDKGYELVGTLLHTSGETITGALQLHGGTEQAMGSSLTYLRRYLLGTLTGIVTDDDEDGAIASQPPHVAEPTSEELTSQILAGIADATTEAEVREWGNRAHGRGLLTAELSAKVQARLAEVAA